MKILRAACGLLALSVATLPGCGSGNEPDLNYQVIYRVRAVEGATTFRLVDIRTGGSIYTIPLDRNLFTVESGTMTFLLANASPPYRAVFEWVSGGTAEINAIGVQNTSTLNVPLTADSVCQLGSEGTRTGCARVDLARNEGPLALAPAGKAVRFELCSPLVGADDCTVYDDAADINDNDKWSRAYDGTIGDARISNIIGQIDNKQPPEIITTPTVIFLEKPEDNVSGIFRGVTDQLLKAQLFIDGNLKNSKTDESDIILSEDI